MNQHPLGKMRQLGVACRDAALRRSDEGREQDAISFTKPGNSLAKAGPTSRAQPMSEANALAAAIALGLTCNWRLELAHFPGAAEWLRIDQRLLNNLLTTRALSSGTNVK